MTMSSFFVVFTGALVVDMGERVVGDSGIGRLVRIGNSVLRLGVEEVEVGPMRSFGEKNL